ncbi:pitrilysin family protein [Paludicola sp. MB14-C6]|uniref:EF-P 5-aminopentanol modification-associated protein YfmH n=1 Tax=Paludihabitans sp. MB14-C6 TaxID=3070656 RepID=UPI0027DE8EC8|nr:pitrilysin family protein [Paludicola sp. MB14-C6]WMJ23329.1 pitrilysin family protein [Paludicola sp. MB14-C6]
MKKQTIQNNILKEEYYSFTHESGLTILLYPMQGYSSSYALFGTKYGSIDTTFKTHSDETYVTVPEGIAHFLEHKLFESEDGDAFSLFAKTGASANAYTSFDKTCYLFSTTDNFAESLKALVGFVQSPYFTEETVKKEQGIIGQEIKMYEDDPNWRVFFNLLVAMYHNNPVRIDIAGTVDSISKIDKDLLYRCYHTFYNLSNMVISIAGNFDVDQAIEIIESNLKSIEKVEVSTKTPDEPKAVAKPEYIQALHVASPLFNVGYKELPVNESEELSIQLKYELILNAVVGKSTKLYKEMYDEGIINSTFGKEVFCGRGYLANIFAGESKQPQLVKEKINTAIQCLKKTGIDETTFERIRKSMYGRIIMNFNDVDEVANDMVSSYFSNNSIYDTINIISELKCDEVNSLLKSSFQEECLAISIINPIS